VFLYPSFVSVIDARCSRECAVPFSKIIVDHVVVELKMICSLLFLFQIQTDVYNVVIRLTGMTMRLWNYVSTFSNLSGERLHQIYSKLRQEQDEEAGVGPSHVNGSTPGPIGRDGDPNYFPPFPRQFDRQRGYKNMSNYQITEPVQKGGLDSFVPWRLSVKATVFLSAWDQQTTGAYNETMAVTFYIYLLACDLYATPITARM
jgi:hypothetical protein